ncbi:MAG: AstB/ChuR-related protein [uncultured bacterium]|uniref:Radical SAM domain protein n=1 Tax=Candidatus Daviesbacteria bacterium GW2011_GWC2_40_12 TaxID=1618431 RepID=A0A0G0QNN1_9BACT|nr:MAG: AstB/ChuR-related protein [uncultured bacterium]KKQ83586.1 MAG: Radical SAM domain protein [Candidatus Daviesbacteria bacterium GW2011_GWF2_38_7]KKR15918.1 MAG: Radical SAM domain protein [Candidatus Daviesbacteria bacterium GW2011_GWA2_39_33]KKR25359.1 MAG: Radical SAM domain protein [Candidatus Daviesbacteria bacterium GW2011_GWB1_39_5]KKR42034.1 MAG: Radical SAM domain protein [Candidatus Daviesbacteria bacterium GW2011_GWC2_40_12]
MTRGSNTYGVGFGPTEDFSSEVGRWFHLTFVLARSRFTSMGTEQDILRERAKGIGAKLDNVSPVLLYRRYTPLAQEISQGIELAMPRRGYSPRYASFQVTPFCNFDCSGCNVKEIRDSRQTPQLTTGEAKVVLYKLKESGTQWVDLTGGEPLIREDLLEIVAYSHEVGMRTTINTNGGIARDNFDKEKLYWRELAEAGLFGAVFSYDGIGEKTDSRVIELAAFLVNTLHIYGGVRTVVTKDNLKFVENIGTACMSSNAFYEPVPAVALGGEISALPNDNFHPLDADGRDEYIEIVNNLRKVRGPFAEFLHIEEAYLKEVVIPATEWHCKNPAKYLIFVNALGSLAVCNDKSLQGEAYSLIGQDNPLLKREFYEAVKKESKECGGCRWLCNWRSERRQTLDRFNITAAAMT